MALVTTSVALVPTSFLLLPVRHAGAATSTFPPKHDSSALHRPPPVFSLW